MLPTHKETNNYRSTILLALGKSNPLDLYRSINHETISKHLQTIYKHFWGKTNDLLMKMKEIHQGYHILSVD